MGFVCSPSFFSLPAACLLFSRGVIFTRDRVSLALLSLRKNGGLLVVYTIRSTQVNLQNSNLLFATREYFLAFGLILYIPIIQVYSLLLLRYMLQPIRIRFTALSCFKTNIYQRVFLPGRTHANKAVTDRQTKFVNKHFITVLSVRPI